MSAGSIAWGRRVGRHLPMCPRRGRPWAPQRALRAPLDPVPRIQHSPDGSRPRCAGMGSCRGGSARRLSHCPRRMVYLEQNQLRRYYVRPGPHLTTSQVARPGPGEPAPAGAGARLQCVAVTVRAAARACPRSASTLGSVQHLDPGHACTVCVQ